MNIIEQKDEETDPLLITGGWLVELDNYQEEGQIKFIDGDGKEIKFTPQSPEILSNEQRNYITDRLTTINNLIFVEDKSNNDWEELVDIDELVKFYMVQELMDNCESFAGSCYWPKEQGEDTKFKAGPVWDFGSMGSHWHNGDYNFFIYQMVPNHITDHWIGEIAKFPHFQQKVRELWKQIYPGIIEQTKQHCMDYVDYITPAIGSDYKRWNILTPSSIPYYKTCVWDVLQLKWNFLDRMWALVGDVNFDYEVNVGDVSTIYDVILGIDKAHLVSADLNGDGNINAGDISTLYEIILATDKPIEQ
mgnify:CR=1 FL=1